MYVDARIVGFKPCGGPGGLLLLFTDNEVFSLVLAFRKFCCFSFNFSKALALLASIFCRCSSVRLNLPLPL